MYYIPLLLRLRAIMKQKIVIFRSKEEAEAATGYFSVSSIMITMKLSDKISMFIQKNGLQTFSQPNQAKTSRNSYTLNFTHKRFDSYNETKPRAYLSKPGAVGYYKQTIETRRSRVNPGRPDSFMVEHKPQEHALKEFQALQERSPSLEQMYFWIARKYPREILWMEYSMEDPSLNSKDYDDDIDDQIPF